MITREEAVRRHRELWNKIAEVLERKDFDISKYYNEDGDFCGCDSIKKDALLELGYNEMPSCYCWCCEYDDQFEGLCDYCPIKFSIKSCIGSEWTDFTEAIEEENIGNAIIIARHIANLPEREIEHEPLD